MIAYKSQLPDEKIQKIASFIMIKLIGTTPENAKAAEGEECK